MPNCVLYLSQLTGEEEKTILLFSRKSIKINNYNILLIIFTMSRIQIKNARETNRDVASRGIYSWRDDGREGF